MSKTIASLFSSIKVKTDAWVLGSLLAVAGASSWHAAIEFTKLRAAIMGQWSYPMQREWTDKLKILNPTITVPDPSSVRKEHVIGTTFSDTTAIITQN